MPTVYHSDGRIEEVVGDEVVWSWPQDARKPVPGRATGPAPEAPAPKSAAKKPASKPAAKKAPAKKAPAKKSAAKSTAKKAAKK